MEIEKENIQLLERTRKELHAHPELSGLEFNTQKRILDFLKKNDITSVIKIGNTGVLAEFNGNDPGKTILIRGDIDALPIQEVNEFEYKSKTSGISHKCGHDGHTTILLGLAIQLNLHTIEKGNVYLLFQPAEENGKGAQAVLDDPYFSTLSIDFAFALHNLPGFPLHQIVIKENEFTSNVKSVVLKLKGKTAHAAEPEKGDNPSTAIARVLQYADERTLNDPSSKDFFLITPIHVQMGKIAYGVSAGQGEVHLTIRSWSSQLMEDECLKLKAFVEDVCKSENLKMEITWLEEFLSNNNHKKAVSFIREAAMDMDLSVKEIKMPFKWGEDFGLFTQRFKGAMFGIGAGMESPALHNPDYDFPDAITPTAVNLFYNIIKKSQDLDQ